MPNTPFVDVYPDATPAPTGPAPAGSASGNPDWPGLPADAHPESFDVTLVAASLGTIIVQPTMAQRFVVVSAFISTDVAGRIAIFDDLDIQGRRIAVHYAAANGGASPNLVPAPYPTATPGGPVRVACAGVGNVFVRVSGYFIDG